MIPRVSPAYTKVLQELSYAELEEQHLYNTKKTGNTYQRDKVDAVTHRLKDQEIVISDTTLFDNCSSSMWYIVGMMCANLKRYNMLWYCDPSIKKSSTNRIALKKLLELNIISQTETTNIYLVNPRYIRRGDYVTVLTTTATMLSKVIRVDKEMITDKRAVSRFEYKSSDGKQLLINNTINDDFNEDITDAEVIV